MLHSDLCLSPKFGHMGQGFLKSIGQKQGKTHIEALKLVS